MPSSDLHRLLVDGHVIDMEQLVLVEHHLLARLADNIVERREFNRIDWACLFTHATEDTTQLINLKLRRVLLAIIPW